MVEKVKEQKVEIKSKLIKWNLTLIGWGSK